MSLITSVNDLIITSNLRKSTQVFLSEQVYNVPSNVSIFLNNLEVKHVQLSDGECHLYMVDDSIVIIPNSDVEFDVDLYQKEYPPIM